MRKVKFFGLIALLAVFSVECKKIQQLPDEPRIEFRNFTVFDTTEILGNNIKGGRLMFYFEDGDGDLGMEKPQDGDIDTANLFFTLFRKTGGVMVQVPDDDIMKPYSYRIPYMKSPTQNKILKGNISITFYYTFYNTRDSDIFRYKFYIKDRAENISNIDSTGEVLLSINGLYLK